MLRLLNESEQVHNQHTKHNLDLTERQTVLVPTDFQCMDKNTMEVNGN